jgi:hypothetical protein
MDILTTEHFKPHVGKVVRFRGTPFSLTLERIEGRDEPPPPGFQRAPFLVIFRGPRDAVIPTGTYECEIEAGPTYSLYVMPIHTAEREWQEYQSAFN